MLNGETSLESVHSPQRDVYPVTDEAFLLPCESRLAATVSSVHASDPTG